MIFYAFVQKDFDYYRIYKIEPYEKSEAELMKLDNYDLAFKISERAINFYYQALRNGQIVKVKINSGTDFIDIKNFVVFRNSEKIIQKIKENNAEIDDEDIKNELFFNDKKVEYLKDLQQLIFPNVNLFQILNMYSFLDDWSTLFNAGFVINDENKEDIFIEIIEKDDDKLLSVLERFLQEREELDKFKELLRNFYIIRDDFDYMSYWDYDSLEEALEDLEKKYLQYKGELENLNKKAKERTENDLALFYKLKQEFKKK